MAAIMVNERAGWHADRDALAKRIRLQFIKREIESATSLARSALAEGALGHSDFAAQARKRALKTYEDFRMYLPLVSDHLTGSERGECEENLKNLGDALREFERP